MYSWIEERGLSNKNRSMASVEKNPISSIGHKKMHHFIYDVLGGKYEVYLKEGQIYHLTLNKNLENYPSLSSDSLKSFLQKHHHFFHLPAKFHVSFRSSYAKSKKRYFASYAGLKVNQYDLWHRDSGKLLGYVLLGKQKKKQVLLKILIQ